MVTTTPPDQVYSYQYGNTCIHYTVLRGERKHLRISVHPDRSVEVRCPEETPEDLVSETVQRRAAWIID